MDMQWILDIDTTIKPIHGRQQGAALGYNPQKPGSPGHAYHTSWDCHTPTSPRLARRGRPAPPPRLEPIPPRDRATPPLAGKNPPPCQPPPRKSPRKRPFPERPDLAASAPLIYEHHVLVTDLPYEILTLAPCIANGVMWKTLRRTQKTVGMGRLHPSSNRPLPTRRPPRCLDLHLVDSSTTGSSALANTTKR